MHGSENIKEILFPVDVDPGATDKYYFLHKAGRAMTVVDAYMVAAQTQNAGTAILARVENWGTAGTAVEGTVTTYLGGTASAARLTANTPAAAVVSSTQNYIDKDEWLALHYAEEGAGWVSGDRFTFLVRYVEGVGA